MPLAVRLRPSPLSSVIKLVEVSDRPLGPSDVRVKVAYAGVNYWDVMQRHGRVAFSDGAVPGSEGSGLVLETGPLVTRHQVGDRVAWSKVPGSYAENVAGDEALFFSIPESIDDKTAAGLLSQGITAQYLSTDTWPLGDGDTAVVTAASGGVGLLLTQMLVQRGVTVVGMVSSEAKTSAVEQAGAELALPYGSRPIQTLRNAGVSGVSVVYDAIGGVAGGELVGILRSRGALVLYGSASGVEAEVTSTELAAGSYYLTRTSGRDYARTPEEVAGRAADVLDRAAAGAIRVLIDGVWRLIDVERAWDRLESRQSIGKVLLRPGNATG